MNRKEALSELLAKVEAGETGWLKVTPETFGSRQKMIEFMSIQGKAKQAKFLKALIAEGE